MEQSVVLVRQEEPPHSQSYPSAEAAPLECRDGSLVIDREGRIVQATPEQQEYALRARRERRQAS